MTQIEKIYEQSRIITKLSIERDELRAEIKQLRAQLAQAQARADAAELLLSEGENSASQFLQDARAAALEEAAQVAEQHRYAGTVAEKIRALKG